MTSWETEMKELGEARYMVLTTQDCWSVPLKYHQEIVADERSLYGNDYNTCLQTHTSSKFE